MVTSYSSPKEMLGYLIVEQLRESPGLLKMVPYDRKSAHSYYYLLRGLHSMLYTFHDDMFIMTEDNQKIPHNEAYPQIETIRKENWDRIYSKEEDLLMISLFKYTELIASSFPKLGLVPESGEPIGQDADYVQEETNNRISGVDNDESFSRSNDKEPSNPIFERAEIPREDNQRTDNGIKRTIDPNRGREKYLIK